MNGRTSTSSISLKKKARHRVPAPVAITTASLLVPVIHLGLVAFAVICSPGHLAAVEMHTVTLWIVAMLAAAQWIHAVACLARKDRWGRLLGTTTRRFWKWLIAGGFVGYMAALALGQGPNTPYVFWLSWCTWQSTLYWATVTKAHRSGRLFRWAGHPFAAGIGRLLYAGALLLLCTELALRIYAHAMDDSPTVDYVARLLKMQPGESRQGRVVNSAGYWDDEFKRSDLAGSIRVAVLGDELTLCGDAQTNFIAQLERDAPAIEFLHFGMQHASPREYANQIASDVLQYRPNMALVFLSVATDITQRPALPGPFDWRGLHIVQRSLKVTERQSPLADELPQKRSDAQERLDSHSRQLSVCRTPTKPQVEACWTEHFEQLDQIIARCRNAQIQLAFVVVPCEFQVDDRLCCVLARRCGYRDHQLDLDLPQRRLAAFAKDRRVTMIDLLPHLRKCPQPSFARDSAMLSSHGHAKLAALLGDWLQSQYGHYLLADGS